MIRNQPEAHRRADVFFEKRKIQEIMKILFISRAYPPIVGGIENQNYGIGQSLSKIAPTRIIANKSGKKNLPIFLPWVTLKSLFIVPKYDTVLLGDGVLAPIGAFLENILSEEKIYFYCSRT